MTPENESEKSGLPKVRTTINIDPLDLEVVINLINVIGRSKSSVICHMVKEWIKTNSDMMMNTWEIDLPNIRRKVLAKAQKVEIDKELEEFEESKIGEFPEIFESAEELSIEEVARIIKCSTYTVKKIVLFHSSKLKDLGLNLTYKNGIIVNRSLQK